VILIDQSPEHDPPPDLPRKNGHTLERRLGRCKGQTSMRALSVVMLHVGPQDSLEVAATEHQDMVQALNPERSRPIARRTRWPSGRGLG